MSMAINFGRVRIYNKEFPAIKFFIRVFDYVVLQGQTNYFSCCITTNTRPVATKLSKAVTSIEKLQPIKSQNPLDTSTHSPVRSHDKLKTFYLHYHNTYGHNTYGYQTTCRFYHVV